MSRSAGQEADLAFGLIGHAWNIDVWNGVYVSLNTYSYAGKTHNLQFRGTLEKHREIANYVFFQHTKNNISNHKNQRYIDITIR